MFWPVILATLSIIAVILNTQRSIIELQSQMQVISSRVQTITQRQDSSAHRAEIRDYMVCRVFEILLKRDSTAAKLPKHCDDVFQNVGYR